MKIYRAFVLALVTTFSVGALSACEDNDGPMEEAGESIDEAAEEVEDEIDDNT